jgi:hypothetical protein
MKIEFFQKKVYQVNRKSGCRITGNQNIRIYSYEKAQKMRKRGQKMTKMDKKSLIKSRITLITRIFF